MMLQAKIMIKRENMEISVKTNALLLLLTTPTRRNPTALRHFLFRIPSLLQTLTSSFSVSVNGFA